METIFNNDHFDEQSLQCTRCNWQGKGTEAVLIDLYGLSEYQEVHCPQCDAFLGNLKRKDAPGGESANPLSFQLG